MFRLSRAEAFCGGSVSALKSIKYVRQILPIAITSVNPSPADVAEFASRP